MSQKPINSPRSPRKHSSFSISSPVSPRKKFLNPEAVKQNKREVVSMGSSVARAQVFNHQEFEVRSIVNRQSENPRNKEIRECLEIINNDIKGNANDNSGCPNVSNIIIRLGKFILSNNVSDVDLDIINKLNQLVFVLLKDSYFINKNPESKLWTVPFNVLWLVTVMRGKNYHEIELLEERTQKCILEIRKSRLEKPAELHPALLKSFTLIEQYCQSNASKPLMKKQVLGTDGEYGEEEVGDEEYGQYDFQYYPDQLKECVDDIRKVNIMLGMRSEFEEISIVSSPREMPVVSPRGSQIKESPGLGKLRKRANSLSLPYIPRK